MVQTEGSGKEKSSVYSQKLLSLNIFPPSKKQIFSFSKGYSLITLCVNRVENQLAPNIFRYLFSSVWISYSQRQHPVSISLYCLARTWLTRINPTLHKGNFYARPQRQNSIKEWPLCSSAPGHHCPHGTRQPCFLSNDFAFYIIYLIFNSCHFIISSLQPTLLAGLKRCLFIRSMPAAGSQLVCWVLMKQEPLNNDTGLGSQGRLLLAASPLLLTLLLEQDCLWLWPLKTPLPSSCTAVVPGCWSSWSRVSAFPGPIPCSGRDAGLRPRG